VLEARLTHAYMPPHEILAATSSRPNSEALAARVAFHPYACGLHRGTAAVAAVLIGYDDMEVAVVMTMRRRRS
jgi:hypothetical protein